MIGSAAARARRARVACQSKVWYYCDLNANRKRPNALDAPHDLFERESIQRLCTRQERLWWGNPSPVCGEYEHCHNADCMYKRGWRRCKHRTQSTIHDAIRAIMEASSGSGSRPSKTAEVAMQQSHNLSPLDLGYLSHYSLAIDDGSSKRTMPNTTGRPTNRRPKCSRL